MWITPQCHFTPWIGRITSLISDFTTLSQEPASPDLRFVTASNILHCVNTVPKIPDIGDLF